MSEKGQAVIAAVREMAAESPDFVYTGECAYMIERTRKPGCLVGQGLWRVGLINGEFADTAGNWQTIDVIGLKFGLDEDELGWLSVVQQAQDNNVAWGEAVRQADIRLRWAEFCAAQ